MRTYSELTLEERPEVQQRLELGESQHAIERSRRRVPSTISRECRRKGSKGASCKAQAVHRRSDRGAAPLVQDQGTSVICGMPGEAVALGAASQALPLNRVIGAPLRIIKPPSGPKAIR